MSKFSLPYGKENISVSIPDEQINGVLLSSIHSYNPFGDENTLVAEALENPIDSPKLSELAKGKNNIVIICSDHTRPVPSKVIIPPMLKEIRTGNPNADIKLLIATGCHRETTRDELVYKFGEEIVANEQIVMHRCTDTDSFVKIGILPSGGNLVINKLAYEADLLISEGFIEPHFFAGFSGGRKSVLPGVSSRETVLANHCSEFIASPFARTGNLENNPIHEDMLWAAKKANLRFIVNVVLDENKKVIYAVAGEAEAAHKKGCDFLSSQCKVSPAPADIVISTNGGYPLDQNIYQAVKGMTAAESTVKEGGVIIMLAKSNDGYGGDDFYHMLADRDDINQTMAEFLKRGRNQTVPDQWEAQILIRILQKATVLYMSDMADEAIEAVHMIPIHSVEEGLEKAKSILNKTSPSITVIPDGIAVMVAE